jgi:hypothetical protein
LHFYSSFLPGSSRQHNNSRKVSTSQEENRSNIKVFQELKTHIGEEGLLMAERPFAYVCSPFRGDVEKNTERAREYCRKVYDAGYAPLAPHLYFPQFLNDNNEQGREAGMDMGAALLPLCCAIVMCGSEITQGMKLEIEAAKRLDIPIYSLGVFLQDVQQEEVPASLVAKHFRIDTKKTEDNSVLKKIAAARKQGVPVKKPKPGRPRKTQGEAL